MDNLIYILIGALVTVFIELFIKKLWNRLESNKKGRLLYDFRKYENIVILCIWNPTSNDIEKKEITTDFRTNSYNKTNIKSIAYSNSSLKNILRQESNDYLIMDFETFSKKSGVNFVISGEYEEGDLSTVLYCLLQSGEINNKNINLPYERGTLASILLSPLVSVLCIFIIIFIDIAFLSSELLKTSFKRIDYFISAFLIFIGLVNIIREYVSNKKPKELLRSFDGKKDFSLF